MNQTLGGDMRTKDSPWRDYERLIAAWCSEEYSSGSVRVTPNAKIIGTISNTHRQIDVLIETWQNSNYNNRVIVDAKRTNKKLDIKDVEEFWGMMQDCSAAHGILVCSNGYTNGAKQRARQLITLLVKTIDELCDFNPLNWDDCSSPSCMKSGTTGLVLWDRNTYTETDGLLTVYCIGRCDKCRQFNIWCWDCGEKFSLTDEDEYKCNCESKSFWLTAIEEEDSGLLNVYLFLIFPGIIYVVDKKALK